MGIASTFALVAVAVSVGGVTDAGQGVLILETWRAVGLGVFAGLFALLSYRPRHYAGVWELVILNKLILTLVALTHASGAKGAEEIALYDGTLTGILVAAYVLCRGWSAWSAGTEPRKATPDSHEGTPDGVLRFESSAEESPPNVKDRHGRHSTD